MRKSLKDFDDPYNDTNVRNIAESVLPDPALLDYYNRLSRREILWNDDIGEEAVDLATYIFNWNRQDRDVPVDDRQPIKIFINTDGGCLNSVMMLIDAIKLSKTPVITIGMGKCYSSGGLLLMAGHKRYVFPHTSCLIHSGYTGAIGDTAKVTDSVEFTKRVEEQVKQYILESTSISKNLYDKNYRVDWFLTSDEILKYQIADCIITEANIDEIF
jgi:ATP-dependent Clp protease, protease subunit